MAKKDEKAMDEMVYDANDILDALTPWDEIRKDREAHPENNPFHYCSSGIGEGWNRIVAVFDNFIAINGEWVFCHVAAKALRQLGHDRSADDEKECKAKCEEVADYLEEAAKNWP